ncbi:hypothetical protein ACLOJK_002105 [Asimina triloba]
MECHPSGHKIGYICSDPTETEGYSIASANSGISKMTNAEEGLPEEGLSLQKGEKAKNGGLPPQKGEKAEEGLVEKGEKAEEGLVDVGRIPLRKGEKEEEGLLAVQKGKGFRNPDLNRGDEMKTLAEEKNDDIYSKAKLYNAAGICYTLAKSCKISSLASHLYYSITGIAWS